MLYRVAAGLAVTLTVVGCMPTGPQMFYLRSNATPAERSSDMTYCEVAALQQVPRAMAIERTPTYTTPVYTTPVSTNCYGNGYSAYCTSSGGQTYGGQTYGGDLVSYDANLDLRERVQDQCMASRGYALASLPKCKPEQVNGGRFYPASGPMPDVRQIACYADDPRGFVALSPA